MELSTSTYKLLLSNKDELVKFANRVSESIQTLNQTLNESMDKLVINESNANKKRRLSRKRKLFSRPGYLTRSKRKYLVKSTSTKNMKRIYLTKYSLNLIKKSIKGLINGLSV